jgi:hypothetical protein
MGLIIKNQENNWAYVLVILLITAIAGGFVVFYSMQTIEEINYLSAAEFLSEEEAENN